MCVRDLNMTNLEELVGLQPGACARTPLGVWDG